MKCFTTLSDYNFLAKGLALYKSLIKTTSDFILCYLTLDSKSYDTLTKLNLPNLKVYDISNLELLDPELVAAKNSRPYNEYCWTLASYFTQYILATENPESVMYIDSDIYFYNNIDLIYQEIDTKSVGILLHRHNYVGHPDGAYNVGVVYFKNSEMGTACLSWWRDAVLYKKYPHLQTCGDQKYLEEFIPRFGEEHVHVIDKIGHGAPWNYRLYNMTDLPASIIYNNVKQIFVFNHFSRFSYNSTAFYYTSNQYLDHTINNQIFLIPQLDQLYKDYYTCIINIHKEYNI